MPYFSQFVANWAFATYAHSGHSVECSSSSASRTRTLVSLGHFKGDHIFHSFLSAVSLQLEDVNSVQHPQACPAWQMVKKIRPRPKKKCTRLTDTYERCPYLASGPLNERQKDSTMYEDWIYFFVSNGFFFVLFSFFRSNKTHHTSQCDGNLKRILLLKFKNSYRNGIGRLKLGYVLLFFKENFI